MATRRSWTESFFVWSALSYPSNTAYGLQVQQVQGQQPSAGANIILEAWAGGQPYELWQYIGNRLVSYLDSSLVIGLGKQPVPGDYFLALVEINEDDLTQIWSVNAETGLITNAAIANQCMSVGGGLLTPGAQIVTYPLQTPIQNWEIWRLAPAMAAPPAGFQPAPAWCFIQSKLSPVENGQLTPYVLTVDANNQSNVILASAGQGAIGLQTWQFTADGRFLNTVRWNKVLTAGPGAGEVTLSSGLSPTPDTQLWSNHSSNTIVNSGVNQYLTVDADSPFGNPPVVTLSSGTPNASNTWYLMPSGPLDGILAQNPTPFPAFIGDELQAYQCINQHLGLGSGLVPDFRMQYLNLDVQQLALWIIQISNPLFPCQEMSGCQAVVNQLTQEVTMVVAVRALFANYTTWHEAQFADQGAILNGLIADAGMEMNQETSVGGVVLTVAQGVLYTVLEAIPEVGNVLGNIVNVALNAALSTQTISANPFQVAVSELWNQLSSTFEAILDQVALMETAILSDWGKLQATYPYCLLSPGAPGSLSATALSDANLLAASTRGYKIAAMQILMPAKYQIYMYQDNNGGKVSGIDSWAQYVEQINDTTWTKYWIADSTDWGKGPNLAAMQDIFGENESNWPQWGVSDFFQAANGWGFAVCYVYRYVVNSYDALVTTIANQTPNMLTVEASVPKQLGSIQIGGGQQSWTFTLLPYVSVSIGALMTPSRSHLPRLMPVTFKICDPNLSTQSPVASFVATQHAAQLVGGLPSVSNQSASNGYVLGNPICNQAATRDDYPGTVQMSVYLTYLS